jgi:hypothetical protein
MKTKKILVFCSIALGFFQCADEAKSTNQKLAGAYCSCTTDNKLVTLNQEAELLLGQEEQEAKLTRLLEEINVEHMRLKTCLLPATSAFGKVKANETQAFRTLLHSHCPNIDSSFLDIVKEWMVE